MNVMTTLVDESVETPVHPLCIRLRELRQAAGLSLLAFEKRSGIPSVVMGSYERGDRVPSVAKLDKVLRFFGYRLDVVPLHGSAVRLPVDMIGDLRTIADQLEYSQLNGDS